MHFRMQLGICIFVVYFDDDFGWPQHHLYWKSCTGLGTQAYGL